MSSWGAPPKDEGPKQVLQISNHSRKIKKPPLPPKTAARSPVLRYEPEKERIIHVKTPVDFKYIVQLLTGDPNLPPPVHPCNCDDDKPKAPDRPQGILSPTPTSLPPLFSPDAFTPSPSPPTPPPPLPSSDQELCIFDLLEEWAEPAPLSSYPIVNSPSLPPPPPPPPPRPLPPPPTPIFRVPLSPFRTVNTEIPPSFNTPLPPLFFPPNHFPHNN